MRRPGMHHPSVGGGQVADLSPIIHQHDERVEAGT